MNIMKKFVSQSKNDNNISSSTSQNQHQHQQSSSSDTSLSLAHLNKLFAEIKSNAPQIGSTQQANEIYEQKIYNLLPLFCKVFGGCTSGGGQNDMFDKFSDLTTFTQVVSRLMVGEIRRRASSKTTENASQSIIEFLEMPSSLQSPSSDKKGWILLSTLNLLVCSGCAPLIPIMTSTSLPSTLVKCLYLFFDLPQINEKESESKNDEVSQLERRLLLQRVFSQLLTRLCSSPAALTELTRKDDLALLFNAITSWCARHNCIWRRTASDVILTMAKNNVINSAYLHEKGCIAIFVENMQRMSELGTTGTHDIVEMLSTLVIFLAEVTNSSPSSAHVLLDDFKTGMGYHFLVDFCIKLESSDENRSELLEKVMGIIVQLAKVGISELKLRPLSVNQLYIMKEFSMPKTNSKNSIRNLSAFNVFQTLWIRCKNEKLQELILDAVITLYKDDKANYFILESQNSLSQFADKLQFKPINVEEKYFSLLEFVVYELNYVPSKELISISKILESKHSIPSVMVALKSLHSILKFNPIFRDVFRDVGILDIVSSLLIYYFQSEVPENEQLIDLLLDISIQMLSGPNNQNCVLFTECGASKHVFTFISNMSLPKHLKKKAFLVSQQLILSNNGEEHLTNLLALMHLDDDDITSYLNLKSSILKSLLVVLRESHRVRALFRKVGGFVYVMSVLVHMEGCLSESECSTWKGIDPKKIWNLLRCVFATLTTAMRYEPANAKFFAQEICSSSLTDSVRLLGCFSNEVKLIELSNPDQNDYSEIFSCSLNNLPPKWKMNQFESACLLMRLLYDMAIDVSDKKLPNSNSELNSPQANSSNQSHQATGQSSGKRPPHLQLAQITNNGSQLIIHSSVLISMFQLIPSISSDKLRSFLIEILRSLLKSERNQQTVCESGLISEILLDRYNIVLLNENHSLHPSIQYILERLSSQQIQPKELRTFLRLGLPLNCIPFDELQKNRPKNQSDGGPIALTRIKTLVSMTTPKDGTAHHLLQPPFVEFDMNQEGFSCLFIPSIAPISLGGSNSGATNIITGAIVGNNDLPVGVNGGIGTGERVFPPQSGITFLTWICVEKFTSSTSDEAHNIRLLTIYRASQSGQEFACLQVQIAARDKALIISTQEIPIFTENESGLSSIPIAFDSDYHMRVWSPELIQEGHWHHVAIVLNRALLKNSTVNVYIDGQLITSQKLHYISSLVSGNLGISNASPLYVNGFVGTPPHWRKQSKLVWKQGPCHFIEDALPVHIISYINSLGPNYIGSFQGCTYLQQSQQQIPEDRVIFGLNSRATSIMTLAKMRRVYSKFDSRQISKILGISTHENATPINVLHNSAGHLCGPSRPLGAILIGNIGARCFVPKPVSVTFTDVGGACILLGLIANSQDIESLYASVKALVCVIRSNRELQMEMERINGYQTLAMIFRKKRQFLNSHVLHLTFNLVGTLDVNRRSDNSLLEIQQIKAFKDLLSDQLDLWAQNELLKSLLEHFNELLFESSHTQENKQKNVKALRELGLLPKLLHLTKESSFNDVKSQQLIYTLIYKLLYQTPRQSDLLYFGQFIASLLPVGNEEKSDEIIELRNSFLKIILQLMTRNLQATINYAIQEEIARILGFDWFLLFLQGFIHKETVTIALVNLMILLSNQNLYIKFKEGTLNGGWLKETEAILENRFGLQLLGFNVGLSSSVTTSSPNPNASATTVRSAGLRVIRNDLLTIPGFLHLGWLMTNHVQQPKVYLILFQALMGQYQKIQQNVLDCIDTFEQLNLDNLWTCLFGEFRNTQTNANLSCRDLSLTILTMVHALIWDNDLGDNFANYPVILIQFLMYLYHNRKDFQFYCQTNSEFINSLCQTIITEEDETVKETPVSVLTNHPAKKVIMEFIRLIIIDSITSIPTNMNIRPISVVELFFEGFQSCKQAQTELIASLIEQITSLAETMSQQVESNFTSQQQQQQQQLQQQHAATNIVLFISLVVDKLWQDCYLRDCKEILDCELKLLTKLNLTPNQTPSSGGKSMKSLSELNLLYKSLDRTVLYLLSRPLETISDRMSMLEVIQRVHTNRQLILISPCNSDAEFYVCLTYCILQLIDEEKISLTGKSRTTWHVVESGSNQNDEGALLIASVARKIWDEIYLSKRAFLEELLKINLVPSTPAFGLTSITPEISNLRPTLYEPTLRVWINYVEYEQQKQRRKNPNIHASLDSPSTSSPTNILSEKLANINKFNSLVTKSAGGFVSKIVGGTTGVVGTAISTAVGTVGSVAARKEAFRNSTSDSLAQPVQPWLLMNKQEVHQWTLMHLSIINDLIEFNYRQKIQSDHHLAKYVYEDWIATEAEMLVRERAIWGPDYGSQQFDKWKLDMTEGPHRMRKKMMRNDLFYLHYPYRVELEVGEAKTLKYKLPVSFDSNEYHKRFKPENLALLERDSIQEDDDSAFAIGGSQTNQFEFQGIKTSSMLPIKSSVSSDQEEQDNQDSQDAQDAQDGQDTSGFVDISSEVNRPGSGGGFNSFDQIEMQTVLRLLEEGERISHMFRCARIEGLDTFEGLLLFGKEHFYLIDGFTLLKTREIRDIDSLPANMHDPIVPSSSPRGSIATNTKNSTKKTCSKFAFEDIKEVHKRRYLLQPIALEVFSLDGRNSLLVFPRKLRNKVYSRFMSVATAITDNAQDSLAGQKRNVNVENAGILSNLMGETSVTQRWVRGEISNFQYLMHLNTLAGRSYNDLMQYPVFPWILSDYTSSELDLSDPLSFRDLSGPMGAQTPDRLDQFKKRFNEWDDPHGETPPYHYGTFYSSAMIVASYLVRMEPFTQHFLRLQGGHFDLADRMFHSVGDAWTSASKHNMADLKELIPEFFYLPEFLVNSNKFDLGIKQNGVQLDDVILPTWAKGDPREFIRVHRQALECDYVSAHLNEWIDLIFGYKQHGPAAVEAVNVFHHLFYEGNVDIYSIDDPLKKNATIGFINNFGQIPKQLFKKPHPVKKVSGSILGAPLTPILPAVGLNSVLLTSSNQDKVFIHNLDNLRPSNHPVKELRGAVGQIIQQEKTLLAVEQNKVLIPPQFNRYVAWGFADHSLRIGPYESERALFVWESDLVPPNGEILCCTVPNPRIIITAGTNSVISVWKLKSKMQQLSLVQNLYGHIEPITCLTSSAPYGIIVSGSRDCTCIIWDLNRLLFVRQLGGGPKLKHSAPIAAIAINDLTGDIATCSSNMLFLWTINGILIANVNTLNVSSTQNLLNTQILCVAFSTYNEWDQQNVIITGSSDGVVRMWSLDFVQVPIDIDDLSEYSSSGSSTPTQMDHNGDASSLVVPTKDEIVRRLSVASATAESNKDEDEEETTEENCSEGEDRDNEWDVVDNVNDELTGLSITHSRSSNLLMPAQKNVQKSVNPNIQSPSGAPLLELPKIRTSKSDTSLIDSFIVVNEQDCNKKKLTSAFVLKPGFKWKCHFVFRSKLTMHTAFERKDNTEPAAITALAISRDNKTVFVGDARGRVFSWSVGEGKGMADHWIKDDLVESCTNCNTKFTFSERRHHCRNCGHVFCAKCSKYESEIYRLKIIKPVRVCQNCYEILQQQNLQYQVPKQK